MINLVLIHGWGCDSRTWQPLLEPLQKIVSVTLIDLPGFGESEPLPEFSLDAVLDKIAAQLPENAVVMGWSLGGMLAVQLAARFPEHIRGLITLAANVKFVATPDYPAAMARATNRQFNQGFAQDPQATLKLFSGLLAQGDAEERSLLKQLRRSDVGPVTDNWLQALQLLSVLDNREAFAQLALPGLHLLAEKDALVPVTAAEPMAQLNPRQQIQIVKNSAHALHWSQPQMVVDAVARFVKEQIVKTLDLDKKKVAQSFSRAAATYDSVAQLQRDIGTELMVQLPSDFPAHTSAQKVILDLGSGTGFFTRQLAQQYGDAQVIGLDIAQGMLHYAAAQHAKINWLCADAEVLPLADNSVDLIFSSLAIQWCNDLPQLLSELARVLKPGGQLHIATLGPNTLHELKSAWQQVDNYVHVNRFQSAQDLTAATESANLFVAQLQQEIRSLYYERLSDLTRELKALGAHNVNAGKPEGLTGRARLLAFKNAYEVFRGAQGLPATYDVIYLTANKEAASKYHG
ncbi:malonyl-ACP O-methyltransferase BioC [Cellvibrio sp. OA-2007]|uniref:malonyl-ACP O-methyltransferase BioC n=1 Tax=Cellvibrio sp. OA-2007 TaxID=529823 RepID=UPI0007827001|nr:malonyl-ACP O-methyltransferase BioC [Cellvibrio sp. OA-2007]